MRYRIVQLAQGLAICEQNRENRSVKLISYLSNDMYKYLAPCKYEVIVY